MLKDKIKQEDESVFEKVIGQQIITHIFGEKSGEQEASTFGNNEKLVKQEINTDEINETNVERQTTLHDEKIGEQQIITCSSTEKDIKQEITTL